MTVGLHEELKSLNKNMSRSHRARLILSACNRCSSGIRPHARCPRRDDEWGRCRDKDTSFQKRENIWQDSVLVNLCGTLCCEWACRMPEVSPNALSWTWLPGGGESSTSFLRAEEIPALKGEEFASSCSLTAPFIHQPGAVAFALLSQSDLSAAPSPDSPLLSHCQLFTRNRSESNSLRSWCRFVIVWVRDHKMCW